MRRTFIWRSSSARGVKSFDDVSAMLDGSVAMPPSPPALMPYRMLACAPLILATFCATLPAQWAALETRPGTEPITPIPLPPAQDPKRIALGEQLFHDPRLSHDNRRSCVSCHDTRTNGASADAHDATPQGKPLALNTPTVFNAALSFRLNWEGDFRTLHTRAPHRADPQ